MKGLFIIFFAAVALSHAAFSQTADSPGLPYHVPHILEIFVEAIEHPTDTNAFVRNYTREPGFPIVKVGKTLKPAEKKAIETWISTEVATIQRFQVDRKKNYDKYYLNLNN